MTGIPRTFFAAVTTAILAAIVTAPGCSRSPEEKKARYLEAGRKRMEKKDYARAILEFKNAVRAAPKQAEPYYRLGLAYLAAGDLKSGVASLRKASELEPRHTDAQLKLAQLMTLGDNKEVLLEAEKRASGVLAGSPDNIEAIDILALAELKLGKPEDAERRLEQALTRFPQHLQSSVELAKIRFARKDYRGAEDVLKKAAAQVPPVAQAAIALGEFYVATNRLPEAETQLRRALQIERKNAVALLGLAGVLTRTGRMDETGKTLQELATGPQKAYKPAYALFLFQTGKRDAALAEFERLAKEDPADRDARGRLVAAYVASGRRNDAERILTSALKENAKDVDALLQRSKLYLLADRSEDARKDLNHVISYRPESAEAHALLARVHERRGAALSQRQELTEALRLNPGLLDVRVRLAGLLIASGAPKAALDLMNQAPAAQRNLPQAVAQRNWALIASGDKAQARAVINAAPAAARAPELLVQDAVLKIEAKDYTGARASLEEALKQNPDNPQAADLLARTHAAQGKPSLAIDSLRQLAAKKPGSARLQNLLGQWLAGAGKRDEARKAFAAAKAADPRSVPAGLALAQLDLSEGKLDAARNTLASLIAATPDSIPARLLLAGVEDKAGHAPAAMEHYHKALELDARNVTALNNLACLLTERAGQPDEALKYAQQAKELAPDNPAIDDTLGWAFYRKGIYYSAVKHLENAVRQPTAIRKYHLAMAYIKAGDEKRGRQALDESLKLDPNLAEAKAALSGGQH